MSTPNTNQEQELRKKLLAVNLIRKHAYAPNNVVLVTLDDVIEIFHELVPYTMAKLDELEAHTAQQVETALNGLRREVKPAGEYVAKAPVIHASVIDEHINGWRMRASLTPTKQEPQTFRLLDIADMPGGLNAASNTTGKRQRDVTDGKVIAHSEWKVACKEHGAMNCVSADRKIWRCPTCNVGAYVEPTKQDKELESGK